MNTEKKSRPILYSAPMARAKVEGQKTQTRRIVKHRFDNPDWCEHTEIHEYESGIGICRHCEHGTGITYCPYGKPGDLLWGKESFSLIDVGPPIFSDQAAIYEVLYKADGFKKWISVNQEQDSKIKKLGSKPSIFMPRWASRIHDEIVDIRVERLQDITEEDAIAEGLKGLTKDGTLVKYGIPDSDGLPGNDNGGWTWSDWNRDPRVSYRRLWESINGPKSWDLNPWVWVIETKAVAS